MTQKLNKLTAVIQQLLKIREKNRQKEKQKPPSSVKRDQPSKTKDSPDQVTSDTNSLRITQKALLGRTKKKPSHLLSELLVLGFLASLNGSSSKKSDQGEENATTKESSTESGNSKADPQPHCEPQDAACNTNVEAGQVNEGGNTNDPLDSEKSKEATNREREKLSASSHAPSLNDLETTESGSPETAGGEEIQLFAQQQNTRATEYNNQLQLGHLEKSGLTDMKLH
jgi:hypothetical protein